MSPSTVPYSGHFWFRGSVFIAGIERQHWDSVALLSKSLPTWADRAGLTDDTEDPSDDFNSEWAWVFLTKNNNTSSCWPPPQHWENNRENKWGFSLDVQGSSRGPWIYWGNCLILPFDGSDPVWYCYFMLQVAVADVACLITSHRGKISL